MNRLDQLFQQFLRERTYITNVTPSTREWYQWAWKAFNATQATALERAARAPLIGKADLQRFVVELRARGVKPITCNTCVRALNGFCRWLHEQGEVPALVKLKPQRLETFRDRLRSDRKTSGSMNRRSGNWRDVNGRT
jgi:site-specific recombinase XerD